ncbi:Sodium/calcium exchanger protein-domain-containing protein [Mycena belliarum]|uniref:Sodium/calcium exchanger protein-domain-containing protein n=1 Tax=Mycena belliarum TaxID=1033014 RepID=A0AAD6UMY5_9AGAR|nr:Sodium/calcium exchanger protein-domain-containing protein [Mycena belliae]
MDEGSSSEHPLVQDYSPRTNGDLTNGMPMSKVQSGTSLRPRRTLTGASNGDAARRSMSLRRAATSMLTPEKKVGQAPSVLASIRSIITASWLNLLLVFIPVSWAFNFADKDQHTLIFVFSFLAIIPLAKLLAFATDELSMRVGQTLAGLLNATLGNAVELIVAIIALTQCQLGVVQSSLIGSILSNLLLVLGMCFFAGGVKFSEQGFGASATQLNSSLLTISVIAVLLPTAFRFSVTAASDPDSGQDILKVSHGVAIILLFIYGSYLFFQLYSHATLYGDKSDDIIKSTRYAPRPKKNKKGGQGDTETGTTAATEVEAPTEEEEEEETPQLSLAMTIGLLVVVTVVVAVTAEWLVDSIDGLTEGGAISKEFVGVILLPIVGNAAEHVTAVSVSVKDKLTLSLGVAVGSSIQIALFVIPFIITLAWILGKPLTMLFDPFESIALFLSVITVNYVVQDGKSNWLEGMILMCLYIILGTTFWFYPGTADEFSNVLPKCK